MDITSVINQLQVINKSTEYEKQFIRKECKTNGAEHEEFETDEKPYICNYCEKAFSYSQDLLNNERTQLSKKFYKCKECELASSKSKQLIQDKNVQKEEKKLFKCLECGKSFAQIGGLIYHKKIHTSEKPYECEICGNSFRSSGNLTRHKLIHTGKRLHQCDRCEKSFVRAGDLHYHIRTHTGVKPFKCQDCGKAFNKKNNLNRHIRIHTGEKPYKCKDCGAAYNDSDLLKRHNRIVHLEILSNPNNLGNRKKVCQCELCGKVFYDKSTLKIHKLSHTGERPHNCECGKTYILKKHLNRHKKTCKNKNPLKKPYECEECGKGFTSLFSLKRHRRRKNQKQQELALGISYTCDICKKTFDLRTSIVNHLKFHLNPNLNSKNNDDLIDKEATVKKEISEEVRIENNKTLSIKVDDYNNADNLDTEKQIKNLHNKFEEPLGINVLYLKQELFEEEVDIEIEENYPIKVENEYCNTVNGDDMENY